MGSNIITKEEQSHLLLPPKEVQKDQTLRRVFSDIPAASEKIIKDLNNNETNKAAAAAAATPEIVNCECCGMSEECTPKYISRIRGFYCGKWICGLCSEAVKEEMKRKPSAAIEEVMEAHMAFCRNFNGTTRANPNLSFAGAMRDIARKSFNNRSSKISRTSSCGPRIYTRMERSPIQ